MCTNFLVSLLVMQAGIRAHVQPMQSGDSFALCNGLHIVSVKPVDSTYCHMAPADEASVCPAVADRCVVDDSGARHRPSPPVCPPGGFVLGSGLHIIYFDRRARRNSWHHFPGVDDPFEYESGSPLCQPLLSSLLRSAPSPRSVVYEQHDDGFIPFVGGNVDDCDCRTPPQPEPHAAVGSACVRAPRKRSVRRKHRSAASAKKPRTCRSISSDMGATSARDVSCVSAIDVRSLSLSLSL